MYFIYIIFTILNFLNFKRLIFINFEIKKIDIKFTRFIYKSLINLFSLIELYKIFKRR